MPLPVGSIARWGIRRLVGAASVPRRVLGAARNVNELGWAVDNLDRGLNYALPHYRRVVNVKVWGNKLATKRKLYYLALSTAFGVLKPTGPIKSTNSIRVRVDHNGRYVEVEMGIDMSGIIGQAERLIDASFVDFLNANKEIGTAKDLNDNKVSKAIEKFRNESNAKISLENMIMGPSENVYGGTCPPLMRMFIGKGPFVFGQPGILEAFKIDPIGAGEQIVSRHVGIEPGPPDPKTGEPDYRTYGTDLTRVVTEALMDPWELADQNPPVPPPATANQSKPPQEWSGGGIDLR